MLLNIFKLTTFLTSVGDVFSSLRAAMPGLVPNPPIRTSDSSTDTDRNADSFLLEEYKHLSALLRENEEAGDRRITLLLTLTTAVSAGLMALFTSKGTCPTTVNFSIIVNGSFAALLVLGLITLRRVYKRNKTTDSYKVSMDYIRFCFAAYDRRLVSHHPFKTSNEPLSFWERHRFLNGGLLTITCILNSAFISALCMMNADIIRAPSWLQEL